MNILLSGGGTGGHIYPALALYREIKRREPNSRFLYVGSRGGLEKDIVSREGLDFQSLVISGFKRKLSVQNVKTVIRFIKGIAASKKMMKHFKPDVVVGTGGYVCGPVVYAAAKQNIPTIIHEQNSVPGLTNKFLSRYVHKVAISLEASQAYFPAEKVVYTGNPRASEVLHVDGAKGRQSVGMKPGKKSVLIFGGSRGAEAINAAFLSMLPEAAERDDQFVYVTGTVHYDAVMAKVAQQGHPNNVIVRPFIHNMPEVMAGVDLVVSRAGATTIAELTALGLPSILIPSPYVTNNHQEKNARSLAENGAAIIRPERELTGGTLLRDIDRVLSSADVRSRMGKASLALGKPDAAACLYKVIKDIK